MNVLSLFDGMSCGQIALERARIKVDKYFASEIDKYAIKVTQHNYPDTIQLGDVTKVKGKDLPKIDLLIGGSPCQGFSFAGKQLAFDDPRSKLFFEFVRLKNECNPTYFMLENVKMKREFELIISRYVDVAPIEINSALVSAQNRTRLYWTNIANEPFGLFGDMQCTIPQPKDKGILLHDILETDVPEKYYLSKKMLEWLTRHAEKRVTEFKQSDGSKKASCLTTTEAKQNLSNDYIIEGCIKFGRTDEAKQIRKKNMSKGKDYTPHSQKQITGLDFDKMGTLTTAITKDNLIFKQIYKENYMVLGDGYEQDNRAYLDNGKSGTLDLKPMRQKVVDNYKIRRLTPLECERLQTVPDNYTSCVSDTQRYKMLGNGWTVDVVAYIFSYMKTAVK